MINKEFQELRRQWSKRTVENENDILNEMRENLLNRNGGNRIYTTGYAQPGISYDINICDVSSLFAIDGDMTPQNR